MRLASMVVGLVALILFAVLVLTAGDLLIGRGEEAARDLVPAAKADPQAGTSAPTGGSAREGTREVTGCDADDRSEAGDDSDSSGQDTARSEADGCDEQAGANDRSADEQAGDNEPDENEGEKAEGGRADDEQAGDREPDENERGNGDDAADRGEGEGD
jgi:hypothetical protein